jgi:hypothetical protein
MQPLLDLPLLLAGLLALLMPKRWASYNTSFSLSPSVPIFSSTCPPSRPILHLIPFVSLMGQSEGEAEDNEALASPQGW